MGARSRKPQINRCHGTLGGAMVLSLLTGFGCGGDATGPTRLTETCGPYPDSATSPYILPYAVGTSHLIFQGNCTGGHNGDGRHSYDFVMTVGTPVLAARGGEVTQLRDTRPGDTGLPSDDNFLRILHADGTFATYTHIDRGSALVAVGATVRQADRIALSGNAGNTGGVPHLHFQVAPCPQRSVCGTSPITFRNTDPHPQGLRTGVRYPALPFTPDDDEGS